MHATPPLENMRRATAEDISRIFGAKPSCRWSTKGLPTHALTYSLASQTNMEWVRRHAGMPSAPWAGARARADARTPGVHTSLVRVTEAGAFRRVEWTTGVGAAAHAKNARAALLSHPDHGVVYLDYADRTFLHLGPEQVPVIMRPPNKTAAKLKWEIVPGTVDGEVKGRPTRFVVVESQGAQRVRWTVRVIEDPALAPYARAAYTMMFGDIAAIAESGIPLDDVAAFGFPVKTETTVLFAGASCEEVVSTGEITDPGIPPVDDNDFDVPIDFGDVTTGAGRTRERDDGAKAKKSTAARRAAPQPHAAHTAPAATAPRFMMTRGVSIVATPAPFETVTTSDGAVVLPPPFSEPDTGLAECIASTHRVGSAWEMRQLLLDHMRFAVNAAADRLDDVRAAREAPDDPENTDVTVRLDWLQAMKDEHLRLLDPNGDGSNVGAGDGLFCVLRDEPPPDDITQGGTGVLDKLAEAQAETLVETDEDALDDLTLPEDVIAEVDALLANDAIAADDRWQNLSAVARATIREAVLTQRIGIIETTFNGDSGLQKLPSADWDLLHLRFQMEDLALVFSDDETITELAIEGDRVALGLRFAGLSATFTHTREPGEAFWITAAGTLAIIGVVAITAVASVAVLLAGLGAGAFLVLATLFEGVAFGVAVLLLGITIFLMWEHATITASIGAFDMRTTMRPALRDSSSRVMLESTDVTLTGAIDIEYQSQLPTGLHQVLGWITAGLIDLFDGARETVQDTFAARISAIVQSLPHVCLPTPNTQRTQSTDVLRYRVVGEAAAQSDAAFLALQTLSDLHVAPRDTGVYSTQIDPNPLPRLHETMDAFAQTDGDPYLGYAFSQNLLNAWAHTAWAANILSADLGAATAAAILNAFGAADELCPDASSLDAHIWTASAPRVLLTPYAAWSNARRPYLVGVFDDLRLCVGCGFHKPRAVLEIKFGLTVPAHVGLGTRPTDADPLSLFSNSFRFGNIWYQTCPTDVVLAPVETQSFSVNEPWAPVVAAMDDAAHVAFLDGVQGTLRSAAIKALEKRPASAIPFEDFEKRSDRHVYDGITLAQFTPVRTTLYAVLGPVNGLRSILPDAAGNVLIDVRDLGCEEARRLWEDLGPDI